MPTGYTAKVESGEVTELANFAMICARAFGALIDMRDNPFDAEIPEKFETNRHYMTEAKEAAKQLAALKKLGAGEIVLLSKMAHSKAVTSYKKCAESVRVENDRHRTMRAKVELWEPPTSDHAGLKRFMIEQLDVSITDHRTVAPVKVSASDWFAAEAERLTQKHAAALERHAEESERVQKRNEWVGALRESLK